MQRFVAALKPRAACPKCYPQTLGSLSEPDILHGAAWPWNLERDGLVAALMAMIGCIVKLA
jgi:hypothetical protein